MRAATILAIATIGAASAAHAQTVEQTIDRAVAAWAGVRTVRATFEQTIVNPLTGSSLQSRGSAQQRRPNLLAITFSEPKGDRIIADGTSVWVFLPSETPGQVVKLPYASAGAFNTDLISQFLDAPKEKYDIVDAGMDTVAGRATHALVLTAKPGRAVSFIRAKVWIDTADAHIRQFESTESAGFVRKVRLTTLTPNAPVDNNAFVFRVPAGVRVVEPGRP